MTPPVKPPLSPADLVVSILAIVVTAVGGAGFGAMAFMMVAFTDQCPPETCHIDVAVTSILAASGVALVTGVVGSVWTIVRLVRRRPAWPFAVGTMVVCGALCFAGFVGYLAAVGGI